MRAAYNLPAPIFGAVVWLALWAGACSSTPTTPGVEITDATVRGFARVEATP